MAVRGFRLLSPNRHSGSMDVGTRAKRGISARIRVYIEGVECEAALEFLRSVECDYAQGYYVGKPIPAADMTGMLHDWERGVM